MWSVVCLCMLALVYIGKGVQGVPLALWQLDRLQPLLNAEPDK